MPEFFVWSRPALIEVIEAESAQDAAEEFLGQPVTRSPVVDEPPSCFAQRTEGREAPGTAGIAVQFWVYDEELSSLNNP